MGFRQNLHDIHKPVKIQFARATSIHMLSAVRENLEVDKTYPTGSEGLPRRHSLASLTVANDREMLRSTRYPSGAMKAAMRVDGASISVLASARVERSQSDLSRRWENQASWDLRSAANG